MAKLRDAPFRLATSGVSGAIPRSLSASSTSESMACSRGATWLSSCKTRPARAACNFPCARPAEHLGSGHCGLSVQARRCSVLMHASCAVLRWRCHACKPSPSRKPPCIRRGLSQNCYGHTCTRTYSTHIHIHTYIHSYIHTCLHACVHAYLHTFVDVGESSDEARLPSGAVRSIGNLHPNDEARLPSGVPVHRQRHPWARPRGCREPGSRR